MKETYVFEGYKQSIAMQPRKVLQFIGKVWLTAATIGQYAFGAYVLLVYAPSAATYNFDVWNNRLFSGIIPGEWLGNSLLVFHILLSSVILFGGPIQFMPFIRNNFRAFHRALGKTFLTLSVTISIAGLIMTILGKSFGTPFMQITTCISVIYIVWFAWMTYKNARKRNIVLHEQWALRFFLMTSGVWFLRVWGQSWKLLFGPSALEYTDTFSRDHILDVFIYVIPLSVFVLELYFYALKKEDSILQGVTAVVLAVFTFAMIIGIYGAVTNMWLPAILGSKF